MKRRIYKNMCWLAGLTILLTSILIITIFHNLFANQAQGELKREIGYIAQACNYLNEDVSFLSSIESDLGHRITLIDEKGDIVYDNVADASQMENHLNRPEVEEALTNGSGEMMRLSDTLDTQTYYYTIRLNNNYVIRMSGTMDSVFLTFYHIFPLVGVVSIVIMLFALFLANKMTKAIVNPINSINPKNLSQGGVYDELYPLLRRIDTQNTQIREQMEDLIDQQRKFLAISDNMSEGLVLLDIDLNIISINPSSKLLLQAPPTEYEGKNIRILGHNEELLEVAKMALDNKRQSVIIEVDYHFLQIIANPATEEDEIRGVVLFILDVTEKHRLEKMRKEFSANVSHELKTPLTSISGYAELMQNQMVGPELYTEFATKIYKEAGRLIALVNDIIKISQLDEKNIGLDKEKINLHQLAEGVIENLTPVAKKNSITLSINEEEVFYEAVPQLIDELLYNLIENAVKYNTPEGYVAVDITREEQHIRIKVEDSGIGIQKEYQERVFERFFRVDKSHSKQTGGTGLGLAIVKHVVEYHDGYTEIHSNQDEGTTIVIHFFDEGFFG